MEFKKQKMALMTASPLSPATANAVTGDLMAARTPPSSGVERTLGSEADGDAAGNEEAVVVVEAGGVVLTLEIGEAGARQQRDA